MTTSVKRVLTSPLPRGHPSIQSEGENDGADCEQRRSLLVGLCLYEQTGVSHHHGYHAQCWVILVITNNCTGDLDDIFNCSVTVYARRMLQQKVLSLSTLLSPKAKLFFLSPFTFSQINIPIAMGPQALTLRSVERNEVRVPEKTYIKRRPGAIRHRTDHQL